MSDAENKEPLVEGDHETRMAYQEGTRMPLYVMAVWACAMIGLGIYFFLHYLGDLQKWGRP
jgi:hypothetical protein